ncbi:uncharacterized protein IWZ02DRAFT_516148 [Phyllosticta citriasiana]|uniref:uncharacterized protein n=1 Tax=Phyllosticta citriasiana TaxID=595635 RepID=UPI0030FD71C6
MSGQPGRRGQGSRRGRRGRRGDADQTRTNPIPNPPVFASPNPPPLEQRSIHGYQQQQEQRGRVASEPFVQAGAAITTSPAVSAPGPLSLASAWSQPSISEAEFWDLDRAIDFTDVARFYEPTGELAHEQQPEVRDYNIPRPIRASTTPGLAPGNQPTAAEPLGFPFLFESLSSVSEFAPPTPRAPISSQVRRSSMKRKVGVESSPGEATTQTLQYSPDPSMQAPAAKRPEIQRSSKSRSSSLVDESIVTAAPGLAPQASVCAPQPPQSSVATASPETSVSQPSGQAATANDPNAPSAEAQPGQQRSRKIAELGSNYSAVLPAGKVFPVQIGPELFRLSGASISSDAPSYFSHFFADQLAGDVKTLYIDRDPATFKDIALHLQGYYVKPRDGEHFVKLFADAQFYSLPRLTQQLFKSEIFIQIGNRDFQIPRDIFSSPGDSPNFFSLGFAHFFTTPSQVFPGLDRQTLLRPPSIAPPAIPGRSGDVFADLLRLLQGYPVHVRDENHRADLLRDAKYFHLKGLEQKLLPCETSFNLARDKHEILMRLGDIRQSGISYCPDPVPISSASGGKPGGTVSPSSTPPRNGWVNYARPYADDSARELIVEISDESMRFDPQAMRAGFFGQNKARVTSLFQVISNKMGIPLSQSLGSVATQTEGPAQSPGAPGVSVEKVKVSVGADAWIQLDGERVFCDKRDREGAPINPQSSLLHRLKRAREKDRGCDVDESTPEWVVSRGHWRVRLQVVNQDGEHRAEVVLCAVKLEAFSGERARNGRRGFFSA